MEETGKAEHEQIWLRSAVVGMVMHQEDESALYGIKLYVDSYSDAVADALRDAGVRVILSPTCFRVLHTSFRGNLKDILQQVPALAHYPIKQYTWWRKLTDSIRRD